MTVFTSMTELTVKNIKKNAPGLSSIGYNASDSNIKYRYEGTKFIEYYKKQHILYEWYYIDISTDEWHQNINSRNEAVLAGVTTDYFVDEGLLEKLNSLFETPNKQEVDVWYVNQIKYKLGRHL